ncbi:MAG TPA: rhomboid family intramembrane serine protease, partial [Janthinobacterium sp.]|nr:rhomboid family intramembrane serine protease [Janthinobacterium sp.]
GLSGSMVSLWWHPMINSAGASGAIFGVFGGLLAFMLNPKNAVPRAVMTAHRNSTVFFIGFNLLNGFTHAGIDNGAHIGGLLGGIVFGFLLARPLDMGARSVAGAGRLALSCLACLLVLGALSYPMSHPDADFVQEQRFRDALQTFSQQEKQTIGETQRLIGQVRANAISESALADGMEKQITPAWEHLRQAVAAPKLSRQSAKYPLQQALLRYLDQRRQASALIAAGIRNRDSKLIAESNDKQKAAQLEAGLIQKLTAQ